MEFENKVQVCDSPNARVVLGARGWPLLVAGLLGLMLGLAIGMRGRRRWLKHVRRRELEGQPWPEATTAPVRLPSENPDVETEL